MTEVAIEKETNVIPFRKSVDGEQLLNITESLETARQIKTDFSDEISEIITEQLFSLMSQFGVFIDRRKVNKEDMAMLENAVYAAVYRYYNLEHPLHDVADQVFGEVEDEELTEEAEMEGDGG